MMYIYETNLCTEKEISYGQNFTLQIRAPYVTPHIDSFIKNKSHVHNRPLSHQPTHNISAHHM